MALPLFRSLTGTASARTPATCLYTPVCPVRKFADYIKHMLPDSSGREMPGLVMQKNVLSQRVVLLHGQSSLSRSQQNFLQGLCSLSKGLWQTHGSMTDYEQVRRAEAKAVAKSKPKAKARGRPPSPKFVQLHLDSASWLWMLFQSIRALDGTGVGMDRNAT